MRKFLFLTDTHFRADRPKYRTDNAYKEQFAELDEVAHIILEHGVDAIIHGGDFFHTRQPSHALVADIINWCTYVSVPVFVTIGNHDILGYNLDSVSNSGLGVLFEAGAVQRLDQLVLENEKLVIKAAHSSAKFKDEYVLGPRFDGYTKIITSHNYVIPSETMPFEFVHPKDIKSDADLVLCGHYHVPFDYTNGKTRWINPGALSRWSISEKDRRPTVLLIEINPLKVTPIVLESAKPGDQIFDVQTVEHERQREQNIDDFIKTLESTSFEKEDIEKVVLDSGKKQMVSKEVLDAAVTKIREAKETLQ